VLAEQPVAVSSVQSAVGALRTSDGPELAAVRDFVKG
jgi:hypothetical protein